ncbi:hypothetical protein M436DRAFT_56437 [Aureobasidium namibiae CBS 147.97]|uniref:F-box domain-containing protein n=1 Tax=Aureobasidium namibiae CBS 147.97 TaxID=1043004 RepID=A0A074WHB4_9PEZI
MLSFIDLPPEIRLAIYRLVLQFTLSRTKRIHYRDTDTFYYGNFLFIHQNQYYMRTRFDEDPTRACDIRRPRYSIHDIDELLFLASTCRLLRAELLDLAWSNADLRIQSQELYNDLRNIFYERLSSKTCGFIRTLQLGLDTKTCNSTETKKIAVLIRRRLPQLKELTVYINLDFEPRVEDLMPSVRIFGILPRHVAVEFKRLLTLMGQRRPAPLRPRDPPWSVVFYDRAYRSAGMALRVLQAEVSSKVQKRKEEQAKRELGDQVCDILEDTDEMRSLMVG